MRSLEDPKRSPEVVPRGDHGGDHGVDTETRILSAAREVFTRAGTAGARMQDIAREAGVNQALLHYYFRSKQALADRVFREAAATLFAALPAAIRIHDPQFLPTISIAIRIISNPAAIRRPSWMSAITLA